MFICTVLNCLDDMSLFWNDGRDDIVSCYQSTHKMRSKWRIYLPLTEFYHQTVWKVTIPSWFPNIDFWVNLLPYVNPCEEIMDVVKNVVAILIEQEQQTGLAGGNLSSWSSWLSSWVVGGIRILHGAILLRICNK